MFKRTLKSTDPPPSSIVWVLDDIFDGFLYFAVARNLRALYRDLRAKQLNSNVCLGLIDVQMELVADFKTQGVMPMVVSFFQCHRATRVSVILTQNACSIIGWFARNIVHDWIKNLILSGSVFYSLSQTIFLSKACSDPST